MTPRETELSRLLEQCQAALALSLRENQLLREKINLLVRRVFGSSSEKLDAAQLQLLLEANQSIAPASTPTPELPQAQTSATRPQRKARVPRLPENLPVIEEVIDPEPVKAQPEQWRCIGQEVSEQLDYEPGRFLRRRVVRRKYVHRSWCPSIAITCRSTGWNKSFNADMASICRGKHWPAGLSLRLTGSSPFTNTFKPE